jgi:hypothetical protein
MFTAAAAKLAATEAREKLGPKLAELESLIRIRANAGHHSVAIKEPFLADSVLQELEDAGYKVVEGDGVHVNWYILWETV